MNKGDLRKVERYLHRDLEYLMREGKILVDLKKDVEKAGHPITYKGHVYFRKPYTPRGRKSALDLLDIIVGDKGSK